MMEIVTLAEAKERGLKRYYTGKPCPKGHVSERHVSGHTCIECTLDQKKAHQKAWRRANPDEARARRRARYAANPGKELAKSKEWRAANAERDSARKKALYDADPEKARSRSREWGKANPDAVRANCAKRRARARSLLGIVSPGIRAKLRKLQGGKCACCHVSLKKAGEHLDHIKPLARGGQHDDRNLQLLCPPCNIRKRAKDPLDFARELGRLL